MTALEVLKLIDVSATSVCNFKFGISVELFRRHNERNISRPGKTLLYVAETCSCHHNRYNQAVHRRGIFPSLWGLSPQRRSTPKNLYMRLSVSQTSKTN